MIPSYIQLLSFVVIEVVSQMRGLHDLIQPGILEEDTLTIIKLPEREQEGKDLFDGVDDMDFHITC